MRHFALVYRVCDIESGKQTAIDRDWIDDMKNESKRIGVTLSETEDILRRRPKKTPLLVVIAVVQHPFGLPEFGCRGILTTAATKELESAIERMLSTHPGGRKKMHRAAYCGRDGRDNTVAVVADFSINNRGAARILTDEDDWFEFEERFAESYDSGLIIHTTPERISLSRENHHKTVYVIELGDDVWPDLESENPHCRRGAPCLYVGQTGLEPEIRFVQHMTGFNSSRIVRAFGLRLLPDMHECLGFASSAEAVNREKQMAEKLRRRGYAVWYG